MSNIDIATAFVVVKPDTRQFAAQLQSQVNAAVAAVKVPGVATAGGKVTSSAAAAATATNNLAVASTAAAGSSARQAAAALAVTRALVAQTAAENALTVAIANNASAARIQELTQKSAIATQALNVAQLRQSEGLVKVGSASKAAEKGLIGARTQSNLLQGSLIGLSRVTPVAVFGLGVYGTAAIAAGLAIKGAVGSAADFEQQLNTFQAVTQSTAEEMRQIAEAARRLGADVSLPAISAGDAAVAMTELAKAGLSVNDTLAASKGVLQLASAANIDVASAAQIAATQLNAFQLAGDQATRVAETFKSTSAIAVIKPMRGMTSRASDCTSTIE